MYLDISNLFLFCLISIVVGAVIMLIAQVQSSELLLFSSSSTTKTSFFQYYIFLRFFKLNSDEVDVPGQDHGKKNSKASEFNLPEVRKILLSPPTQSHRSLCFRFRHLWMA